MFATILGFIVGIARLSSNWLLAKAAGGYVEIIRNLPLLLQLLFWYNAVLKALPDLRESIVIPGGVYSQQPRPVPAAADPQGRSWIRRIVACLPASSPRSPFTSGPASGRSGPGSSAPVFGRDARAGDRAAACGFRCWSAVRIGFEFPQAGRFNIAGGIEVLPEFVALLLGLSIYTAAFIAEVVRAGILAVSRGPDRGGLFARACGRADACGLSSCRRRCG